MKRLYLGLLSALFGTLLLAANLAVQPACSILYYQPELPKALRK